MRARISRAVFDDARLLNFRHELRETPGLSSYPHPWLMPEFWRFPTVSMGIGPLNAIYQARFMRYLESRNLIEKTPRKVWAFVGDGETDEVESLGALGVASREQARQPRLCRQLQPAAPRWTGSRQQDASSMSSKASFVAPAGTSSRSSGARIGIRSSSVITAAFCSSAWKSASTATSRPSRPRAAAYLRQEFFGKYPELLDLVKDITDEQLITLHRGGHDRKKVFNAYKRAVEHRGGPTVILAKTVKGYGMGTTQARNASHQEKKLTDEAWRSSCKTFKIPVPDESANKGTPYRPPQMRAGDHLSCSRGGRELGGYMPHRESPKLEFQGAAARTPWPSGRRLQGSCRLDHHGLRQHPALSDERPCDWQADRADRAR